MKHFTLAKRENYASWRIEIRNYLDETIREYDSYWIIDPSASAELPSVLWDIGHDLKPIPLYLNTYLEEVMWAGPIIIPYYPEHNLTNWLFNKIELLPIGYLIQINNGYKDELYEHLQNLIECISPNRNRALFRFYDPRIMFSICTYSDKMIMKQILGPIANLYGWEHGRRTAIRAGDGNDQLYRCLGEEIYNESFFHHIWRKSEYIH